MTSNADKDYLNRDEANIMSGMFLGGAGEDSYSTPLKAPAEWWKDLKVEDLCIMGAEYEMFVDDIKAWAEIVKVRDDIPIPTSTKCPRRVSSLTTGLKKMLGP